MLCLELYADKMRLSSFGTEEGYPVMARILNLPVGMRNGDGIGGARVVGWLPLVRSELLFSIRLINLRCQPRLRTPQRIRDDLPGLTLNR